MLQKWQGKWPSRRQSSQNSYLNTHYLENCSNFPSSITSLVYNFTHNTERKLLALLWRSKLQCVFFSLSCLENCSQFACMCSPLLIAEPSTVDSLWHFFKAVSKDKHLAKIPRMQVPNLIYPELYCLLAGCSFIGGFKFQFNVS